MYQGNYVGRIRGKQVQKQQEEYIEYPDYWTGDTYQEPAQAVAQEQQYYEDESRDINILEIPQPYYSPYVPEPAMPSERHANVRMFIEEAPDFIEEEEPEPVYSRNDRR